jgi:hypothetical protein
MCKKCLELDSKIDRYRRLAWRVSDTPTVQGIGELVETLKAEKITLHPEEK